MNRQQAMKLLGITQEDDEREIKRKYHKMISRFHPDSLNEVGEAHIQRAQETVLSGCLWKIYVGSGGRGFRAFSYKYSSCSRSPP